MDEVHLEVKRKGYFLAALAKGAEDLLAGQGADCLPVQQQGSGLARVRYSQVRPVRSLEKAKVVNRELRSAQDCEGGVEHLALTLPITPKFHLRLVRSHLKLTCRQRSISLLPSLPRSSSQQQALRSRELEWHWGRDRAFCEQQVAQGLKKQI